MPVKTHQFLLISRIITDYVKRIFIFMKMIDVMFVDEIFHANDKYDVEQVERPFQQIPSMKEN